MIKSKKYTTLDFRRICFRPVWRIKTKTESIYYLGWYSIAGPIKVYTRLWESRIQVWRWQPVWLAEYVRMWHVRVLALFYAKKWRAKTPRNEPNSLSLVRHEMRSAPLSVLVRRSCVSIVYSLSLLLSFCVPSLFWSIIPVPSVPSAACQGTFRTLASCTHSTLVAITSLVSSPHCMRTRVFRHFPLSHHFHLNVSPQKVHVSDKNVFFLLSSSVYASILSSWELQSLCSHSWQAPSVLLKSLPTPVLHYCCARSVLYSGCIGPWPHWPLSALPFAGSNSCFLILAGGMNVSWFNFADNIRRSKTILASLSALICLINCSTASIVSLRSSSHTPRYPMVPEACEFRHNLFCGLPTLYIYIYSSKNSSSCLYIKTPCR